MGLTGEETHSPRNRIIQTLEPLMGRIHQRLHLFSAHRRFTRWGGVLNR
jgi:hypothetical protein